MFNDFCNFFPCVGRDAFSSLMAHPLSLFPQCGWAKIIKHSSQLYIQTYCLNINLIFIVIVKNENQIINNIGFIKNTQPVGTRVRLLDFHYKILHMLTINICKIL